MRDGPDWYVERAVGNVVIHPQKFNYQDFMRCSLYMTQSLVERDTLEYSVLV